MMLAHMDANVETWKPACDIAQDIAASTEEQATLQTRAEAIDEAIGELIEGTGLLVPAEGLADKDATLQGLIDDLPEHSTNTGGMGDMMSYGDGGGETTSSEDIESLITDIKDLGVALSALHV